MKFGDGSAKGRRATDEASLPLKRMGTVEWLLLLVLSVLWGGSFFFNRIVLAELPPMTLVLGRVALAAIGIAVKVLRAEQGDDPAAGVGARIESDQAPAAHF